MASNFSAVLRVGIARVLLGPSLGSGVLVAYSIKAQLLVGTVSHKTLGISKLSRVKLRLPFPWDLGISH